MTKHDLKEMRNLGAELGAAKAENEKLRGLLEELHPYVRGCSSELWDRYHATLSQQADPAETTEAFTAVDMATAAAQGFRDGQAAVEQATAQDEREFNTSDSDLTELLNIAADMLKGVGGGMDLGIYFATVLERVEQRLSTSPAQTEQQPVAWGAFHFGGSRSGKLYSHCETEQQIDSYIADVHRSNDSITLRKAPLYAAPIAQTAPQPEQSGWVSAAERVPAENDGAVLVLMADGTCEIACASYWLGARTDFAGWTFRDPDEDQTPTHWMPLPTLSAQGQSNGDS